jgi:hypothetical protein
MAKILTDKEKIGKLENEVIENEIKFLEEHQEKLKQGNYDIRSIGERLTKLKEMEA